jgi:phosphatidate cytidylyltransferase
VVFSGDTLAFFGGTYLSKNKAKLFPSVSPQKTISGAIYGWLGSIIAGLIGFHFFVEEMPIWYGLLTCTLTAGFAQTGDLFESLMKRMAQVKDSGHLMPGHGGFLDRVDGVYFAAPVFLFMSYFAERLFF